MRFNKFSKAIKVVTNRFQLAALPTSLLFQRPLTANRMSKGRGRFKIEFLHGLDVLSMHIVMYVNTYSIYMYIYIYLYMYIYT